MSRAQAITTDLNFVARIASFSSLTTEAKTEIVNEIHKVMDEQRKKHNFIVYKVGLTEKIHESS